MEVNKSLYNKKGLFNKIGLLSGVGFTAEYQAIYDAFTIKPNASIAKQQNILVKSLVNNGVWAKLDVFCVLAGHTNANGESLINWLNPGTFDETLVNAPSFVALEGFTGDGLTNYINTNYIPNTNKINLSQDSASAGFYARVNVTAGSAIEMGSQNAGGFDGLLCGIKRTGNATLIRVNAQVASAGSNADSRGMFILNRTLSTHQDLYRNKTRITNAAVVSTGISDNSVALLAFNNDGVIGSFSDNQLSLGFIGGGLTQTNIDDLYDAFQTYMTSNGKQV